MCANISVASHGTRHYNKAMRIENSLASADLPIETPQYSAPRQFFDAREAVDELKRLYATGTEFLRSRFEELMSGTEPVARYRAFYPEVQAVHQQPCQDQFAPGVRPRVGPRRILHDDHAARSLLQLSDSPDRPADFQPWRAGQHRHIRRADAAAFRAAGGQPCGGLDPRHDEPAAARYLRCAQPCRHRRPYRQWRI